MNLIDILSEGLGKSPLFTITKYKWNSFGEYETEGKIVFTSILKSEALKQRKKLQDTDKSSALYKLDFDYVKPI